MPANLIPAAWAVHLPVVVEEVFRTMLGVELVDSEGPDEEPAELFTAAIFFAGEWLGALLLECPPAEAFAFTHRFMRVPEPTALNDDVKDTLGELTNMIAGNLKAVMPARGGALDADSGQRTRLFVPDLRRQQVQQPLVRR